MATMRNDHEYTKRRDALKRQARRNNSVCHLCSRPIDYNLPYTHPLAFTADHVTAVAAGGRMTGPLLPAHRACNSRRGAKPLGTGTPGSQPPKTSRQW